MRGLKGCLALSAVPLAIFCVIVESCTIDSSSGLMGLPPAIAPPLCFHGRRLRIRGGSDDGGEASGGVEIVPCPGEPAPTKSRAKALRKAAEKDLKKRPEPKGIKAVEEGSGRPTHS